MNAAGNSAGAHARSLRAGARKGLRRRLLTAVGYTGHTRAADAQAAKYEAGELGELWTAQMLRPLEARGWQVWHDLAIPGADYANGDHLVVSPGGRLFLIDSKLWNKRATVHASHGRLWHGKVSRDRCLSSLEFEAQQIATRVGVQVWRIIVVHTAPVAGDGFEVGGVGVVPAARLLPLLVGEGGAPNPAVAAAVAGRVDLLLSPHGGG